MFNQNGKKNDRTAVEEQKEIINAASYLEAIKEKYNNGNKDSQNNVGQKEETGTFQKISLRTKATLFALSIGVVPVLLTGITAYILAEKTLTTQAYEDKKNQIQESVERMSAFMLERYGDAQVLAQLPALGNPKVIAITTVAEKEKLLQSYITFYQTYENITVFDLNGNVTVQAFTKNPVRSNYANQPIFKEVLKKQKLVIIDPTIVRPPGKTITVEQGAALQENAKIEIGSPIKEANTGRIIGVLRLTVPVKNLEKILNTKSLAKEAEYHLVNSKNQFMVAEQKEEIGLDVTDNVDNYEKYKANQKIVVELLKEKNTQQVKLSSYAPLPKVENLTDLDWAIIFNIPQEVAFATQRQLLLTLMVGVGMTILSVGAIASYLAFRATRPIILAADAVKKLGEGDLETRIENISGDDEIAVLGDNINLMAGQIQTFISQQESAAQKAQILANIILKLRESLNLSSILNTTVIELKQLLETDRVIILRFDSEWNTKVIAESVNPGFTVTLGAEIKDTCLQKEKGGKYQEGQVFRSNNIQEAGLTDCHLKMLDKFQVKANLVLPILMDNQLFGLLIAHSCRSTRTWQDTEVELCQQVAIQMGIALSQARLLTQLEKERKKAQLGEEEQRKQTQSLQMQIFKLLEDVEGAASGDLTVRADVTATEIGTVADFFNAIIENLRQVVSQVKQATNQVNLSLENNEDSMNKLSEDSLQQVKEITNTLDSVEKMTTSIREVSESAKQAATVARSASTTAKEGGLAMDRTVAGILTLRETVAETAKKVKRLGESSQQISKVVSLINQIALQTNLLAINASIEAARAGEEGRGFAVVAEEVGELAAKSAAATKEIEQIVDNIQQETSEVAIAMELGTSQVVEGTKLVGEAKQSLGKIVEVSQQIDDLVQSISQATVSQAQTSGMISDLMKQIATISQKTSDSSKEVTTSLQKTVEVAQKLESSVGTFKINEG